MVMMGIVLGVVLGIVLAEQLQLIGGFNVNADVGFGTPQQTLGLLLDTGSSITWVMGAGHGAKRAFLGAASSTFAPTSDPFSITYLGRTHADGVFVRDTVSFAGASVSNVSFGVASKSSEPDLVIGIIGLGYSSKYGPTLVEQMVAAGAVEHFLFSLFISTESHTPGSLHFGLPSHSSYKGKLHAVSLYRKSEEWTVLVDRLQFGSLSTENIPAIVDSGSALLLFPTAIRDAIVKQVDATIIRHGSTVVYRLPCRNARSIPRLFLSMNGSNFSLSHKDLVFRDDTGPSQQCYLAIYADYDNGDTMILGMPWLRKYLTVFDGENAQLYFAPAVQKPYLPYLWVGSVVVVVVIIGFVIVMRVMRHRQEQQVGYAALSM